MGKFTNIFIFSIITVFSCSSPTLEQEKLVEIAIEENIVNEIFVNTEKVEPPYTGFDTTDILVIDSSTKNFIFLPLNLKMEFIEKYDSLDDIMFLAFCNKSIHEVSNVYIEKVYNERFDNYNANFTTSLPFDDCTYLFGGMSNFLKVGTALNIPLEGKSTIENGDTFSFVMQNNSFEIYATAMDSIDGIQDYNLYIKSDTAHQKILHQDYFDDLRGATILWIGDIDGDNMPDMIIDNSHKYSYSAPTLYLSSLRGNFSFMKEVASFYNYFC